MDCHWLIISYGLRIHCCERDESDDPQDDNSPYSNSAAATGRV
jgi:hypothetical protein